MAPGVLTMTLQPVYRSLRQAGDGLGGGCGDLFDGKPTVFGAIMDRDLNLAAPTNPAQGTVPGYFCLRDVRHDTETAVFGTKCPGDSVLIGLQQWEY